MKNRQEKKVRIQGDHLFVFFRMAQIIVFGILFIFSILDKIFQIIPWPNGYENTIAVSSQILTTVVTLVVSIIGIAISLQGDEFFGVKITKLYALRKNKHYTILQIIVISILVCMFNLMFYMLGLTIAAIGSLIVAVLFLLQVVYEEVPIMAKEERAFINILKSSLIFCYRNKDEAQKDLKDSIKYLLYMKNLKQIFDDFKDKSNQEYNEYILMKLLEFQEDLAFELKIKYNEIEQRTIGSSLLENVLDVIFQHIEIPDETYCTISDNKYILTRVLFCIHEVPSLEKYFFHKISGLYQYLSFNLTNHKSQQDLISNILIVLVAKTVEKGDFSIIKAIRYQLSNSAYCLEENSAALNVFAVLSMYLYYLRCSEPDIPPGVKNTINDFVNEGNIIENNTKIKSWKNLFSKAAYNFKVDYSKFISLVMDNDKTLEYYLFGNGAKSVILSPGYLSLWYLTHLFNTKGIYGVDFTLLASRYQNIKEHLKRFGEACLDDNKNFIPTAEMNQIIEFYSNEAEYFVLFRIHEERTHNFFEFINNLKYNELKNDSDRAAHVDNAALALKICNGIELAIKKEWGFDSKLEINNPERYFSVLFDKAPDAINFEESIVDYCIGRVRADLKKATQKTVLYNNERFEDGIRELILKKPQYVTEGAKELIPEFYIKDEQLKEEYLNVCKNLPVFQSSVLGENTIILENGFRFNCIIKKVELRGLSEEELSEQVAKHQRVDGQFVFDGVFLPREEIMKVIKAKYTVLNVIIRREVVSSKDTVFELRPYLREPDD